MRVGVFVGSFNPVHKGHIRIANYIIDNNIVDKVLIIPTLNYWDKTEIIDLKHRINMLKKCQTKNIIIEDKINKLPYTYQIIDELKKRSNDEYYLVLGADNIVTFDKWMHYEDLLTLGFIICERNNIDIKYYLKKLNKHNNYKIIDVKSNEISSTFVRANINREEVIKKYIDINVLKYIKDNNLYR